MLELKVHGGIIFYHVEQIGAGKSIVPHVVCVILHVYGIVADSHIERAAIFGKRFAFVAGMAQKIVVYNDSGVSEMSCVKVNVPFEHLVGEDLI